MAKENTQSNGKNTKKSTTAKTTTKKSTSSAKKTTAKTSSAKKSNVSTKVEKTTKTNVATKDIIKEEIKPVKKESLAEKASKNINTILLVIACLILIIILIIVIKGNEIKLKDGKEVIASIDGKEFVAEDLFDDLKNQYGSTNLINMIDNFIVSKEITDNDEAKEYAESQLASLKQQYEAYGYEFSDVLANYGYESEDQLKETMISDYNKNILAEKYIKEDITDDEINSYYESNIYGDYNAKHILIKPETTDEMTDEEKTAAEDAAKVKAQEVINKLNNGANWSDLVKEYSADEGSVDSDGLIENFTKGDVVDEFFNAVLVLEDGKYTNEPVKSTYGYHVILKVSNTEKPSLEDSKEKVLKAITEQKVSNDQTLITTTWVKIREKYNLKINDTKIEKSYKNSING